MICVRFALLAALFASSALAESADGASAAASDVVILTEESFERETQAATGATTGDWLVEFYAPW